MVKVNVENGYYLFKLDDLLESDNISKNKLMRDTNTDFKVLQRIKNKLRYGYKDKVYSIDVNYDTRVFTPIARDSKKWKRIYNKRTALERINGRLDRDFNLENNKVRGLKKATVMIDIMMIGMLAMAKGHIINNHPENIRKLKTI